MPLLFAITLFVNRLFAFSRPADDREMILPLLGGTPAVWNTCMVFFQAVLLAGTRIFYRNHAPADQTPNVGARVLADATLRHAHIADRH